MAEVLGLDGIIQGEYDTRRQDPRAKGTQGDRVAQVKEKREKMVYAWNGSH